MKNYLFFYLFINVTYICKCCEECCCDCLYSGELIKKTGQQILIFKKGDGEVVEIKTLQEKIDNILEIINNLKSWKHKTLLCGESISNDSTNIEKFKEEISKKEKIFANINSGSLDFSGLNDLEKRSIGSMLGMGIGDAYGAAFEFGNVNEALFDASNYKKVEGYSGKWGRDSFWGWTDDSSMGLCIADSLIVKQGEFVPQDIMRRFLAWYYCGYNNASMYQKIKIRSWGLGGNIRASFENYISNPVDYTKAGDEYTSGNGSIMRNAAIPIAYHKDLNQAMEYAVNQSYITHQGKEAAGCCKLLTYLVWHMLNKKEKDSLKEILDVLLTEDKLKEIDLVTDSVKGLALSKENVASDSDKDKFENWNWKNQIFSYNDGRKKNDPGYIGAYAMDNMAMSLHILYHTTTFEQAINVAVHMCGDADSVASVVGQIAGAFYGVENIPLEWIKKLYDFDKGDFTLKALLLNKVR